MGSMSSRGHPSRLVDFVEKGLGYEQMTMGQQQVRSRTEHQFHMTRTIPRPKNMSSG